MMDGDDEEARRAAASEALQDKAALTAEQRKAEIARLTEMMRDQYVREAGWQPIGTAKRDTKHRLLWNPMNLCCYVGSWSHERDGREPGWFDMGGERINPSHWMPLPEGPKS